jgi:hypothetical protein
MREGLLIQLQGEKQFVLFNSIYYEELYPYDINHIHDRQSKIENVYNIDSKKYPLFNNSIEAVKGTIYCNECLYIPYGWWHELSTISSINSPSISLSLRFNPYQSHLQSAALILHKFNNTPLSHQYLANLLMNTLNNLPIAVQRAFIRRTNINIKYFNLPDSLAK